MPWKDPEAQKAYIKRWRADNPEKAKATVKRWQTLRRQQAIEKYGGTCQCCGEANEAFLVIDHINGDGAEDRKVTGAGSVFYVWLFNNNYPPGYQVLCANCNMAKERPGGCPHQRDDDDGEFDAELRRRLLDPTEAEIVAGTGTEKC